VVFTIVYEGVLHVNTYITTYAYHASRHLTAHDMPILSCEAIPDSAPSLPPPLQ
jgi:hypothetical protein